MTVSDRSSLIIGASGFLGSYLSSECHANGQRLCGISYTPPAHVDIWTKFAECDLHDVDFARFLDGDKLGTCYVLTGGSSVSDSMQEPARDFQKLLPGLARLLEYLVREQKDCHLVLFSSAAVYGNPVQNPISETSPIAPLSPYGAHKWLAEEMVRRYSEIFGLRASILRVFSAYGAGLKRQLFWDILRKYHDALANGTKRMVLNGTGEETRDFIHGKDVARATFLVAQELPRAGHETYNIANGVSVSIRDAATELINQLSEKVELSFSGVERAGDPMRWMANVEKLSALGYQNSVTLEAGLADYVRWNSELNPMQ